MFCLWLTGLPGSGKTTIARELSKLFSSRGVPSVILSMDELRKVVTPRPTYSDEEREIVYRALCHAASLLVKHSAKAVLIDATGNLRKYRDLARELIEDFAEVYVNCPIEVCMEREGERVPEHVEADLYKKASKGTLGGKLPGVTAAYEAPLHPEVEVHSGVLTPEKSADVIAGFVESRWLRNSTEEAL